MEENSIVNTVEKKDPGRALAIAGLVSGIISVAFSVLHLIPGIGTKFWLYLLLQAIPMATVYSISLVTGIIGIALEILSRRKGYRSRIINAGFITSIVGLLVLPVIYGIFFFLLISDISSLPQ